MMAAFTIVSEVGSISGQVDDPAPEMVWPSGSFPRLASIDGSGSYGTWSSNTPEGSMPFVAALYSGPAGVTTLTVRVQVRPLSAYVWDAPDLDESGHPFFVIGARGPSLSSGQNYFRVFFAAPLDEWTVVTLTPTLSYLEQFSADVAAGALTVNTRCLSFGYDVSAIVLDPESARPLRWRQRNDGIGGSSPRAARGVTSQQGSSRHRGYL